MQDSAEICTLKNSHARCSTSKYAPWERQNITTSLMIFKRLVMVCVHQETSNTMFTILSLCLMSVNVLTALLMSRTWLLHVNFSSQHHDRFQITIFSFHYVLIDPTQNSRLTFTAGHWRPPLRHTTIKYRHVYATLHLRHVERSEVQDTAAAHAYVMADLRCHLLDLFMNIRWR